MMVVSLKYLREMFSMLSVLLLFPGFFLYNYLIATGIIPAFLGGYFGVVTIFLLVLFLIANIKELLIKKTLVEIIFFILIAWSVVIVITQYILGQPDHYSLEMMHWSISGLVFNVLLYLIAKDLSLNKAFSVLLFFALLLITTLVVTNIGPSGIYSVGLHAHEFGNENVSTYQGFARSLIFISILLVVYYFGNTKALIVVISLSFLALFFIGARTEMVLLLASTFALLAIKSMSSWRVLFVMFSLSMLLFIAIINVPEMIPGSRMLELSSIFDSSSAQARANLSLLGWNIIAESPIIGNYGAYTVFGGIGSYPHNLLSAWVNLGLPGFAMYLIILFLLWYYLFQLFLARKTYSLQFNMLFMFLVALTLAFILAKDHSYMMFGFVVGLYVNLTNNSHHQIYSQ